MKDVCGDFAMFAFEFHRKVGQQLFCSPRPRGQPKICQSLNAARGMLESWLKAKSQHGMCTFSFQCILQYQEAGSISL